MNINDYASCLSLGILLFVLAVALITRAAFTLNDFSKDLKYINMEIRRTWGEERESWKREKRRLWLSLLPFIKF